MRKIQGKAAEYDRAHSAPAGNIPTKILSPNQAGRYRKYQAKIDVSRKEGKLRDFEINFDFLIFFEKNLKKPSCRARKVRK